MENLLKQVQQNTFQEGPVRLCVRCRNVGLKKETNPRRSPLLCLLGSMPRAVLFLLFYCFASAPWTTLSFSVGGREVVAEPGPTHKVWLRDTGLGSQAMGAHPPEEGLDEMPLHQDQSHRVAFWAEGNTVPFPQSARGSRGSRGSDELPQRLLSDLIGMLLTAAVSHSKRMAHHSCILSTTGGLGSPDPLSERVWTKADSMSTVCNSLTFLNAL